MSRPGLVALAPLLAALALAAPVARAQDLARADAAWAERDRDARDGVARPGPIRAALGLYEDALAARPDDLEARWKLLRALHFAGDFSEQSEPGRRALFERATRAAEAGLERLAARTGGVRLEELGPEAVAARVAAAGLDRRDVARLYFWAAIDWGAWSRTRGLLAAVGEGVANRLHDYTQVALALEPGYEDGAALRLLGRLHAELPRVPFVSGWVDRERALPLVEQAYAMDPEHPGNQLLLALTLLDLAPARHDEALALLARVKELTPRPDERVEDLSLRDAARERWRELQSGGSRA